MMPSEAFGDRLEEAHGIASALMVLIPAHRRPSDRELRLYLTREMLRVERPDNVPLTDPE